MTVVLVILTFAVFLTIDYLRSHKPAEQPAIAKMPEAQGAALKTESPFVAGFRMPPSLSYHPGHTWALGESPTLVRMGLDDFAARFVGRIESVALPKRGQWIRQGQRIMTLLKDGKKAELVSPVEGEVASVNEDVLKDASLACRDPYGKGWLLTVYSPDAQTSFRNLLSGRLAQRWMEEAARRLMLKIPSPVGAVAQDGGMAITETGAHLSDEAWNELSHEFFLV